VVEQVRHERCGHVVREVGDEHPPVLAQQRRPVEVQCVALHHLRPGGLDHGTERRQDVTVDLDGGHGGARLGESQRQRAEARTDLDHPVPRADAGKTGDATHGVGVDDEVLPQCSAGADAVLGHEGQHLGSGQGQTAVTTGS
jgi:hypothetical protein